LATDLKLDRPIHELPEEEYKKLEQNVQRIDLAFKRWKLTGHPDKGGPSDVFQNMANEYEKFTQAIKSARDTLIIYAIISKREKGYKAAAILQRQFCIQLKSDVLKKAEEMRLVVVEKINRALASGVELLHFDDAFDELEASVVHYLAHPRICLYEPTFMLIGDILDAFLQPVLHECELTCLAIPTVTGRFYTRAHK
jgi:hypothetical protein